jgi:hypothetical protein
MWRSHRQIRPVSLTERPMLHKMAARQIKPFKLQPCPVPNLGLALPNPCSFSGPTVCPTAGRGHTN